MISVTLPAKYRCNSCGDLLHEVETKYTKRGRWYYISEICPNCKSKDVESVGMLTRVTPPRTIRKGE